MVHPLAPLQPSRAPTRVSERAQQVARARDQRGVGVRMGARHEAHLVEGRGWRGRPTRRASAHGSTQVGRCHAMKAPEWLSEALTAMDLGAEK